VGWSVQHQEKKQLMIESTDLRPACETLTPRAGEAPENQ